MFAEFIRAPGLLKSIFSKPGALEQLVEMEAHEPKELFLLHSMSYLSPKFYVQ